MLRTKFYFLVLISGLFALTACQETVTSPTPSKDVEIIKTAEPSPNIHTPEPTAVSDINTPEPANIVTPTPSPVFEWIKPVDNIDISGMNLVWEGQNLQFSPDENAKLSLYIAAEMGENGKLNLDDGQDWALLLETKHGIYPMFERKYVQLGEVSCVVFNDFKDDKAPMHVVVTVSQTAGYLIYDCVYDFDENAFKIVPVYDEGNINFITKSTGS